MFTGIVQEIGKIKKISAKSKGGEIEISCSTMLAGLKTGDSICVNGCCLTARNISTASFQSDLSYTTFITTTFNRAKANDYVNLENSLKLSDKISGHFVTGHVDGTAEITKIKKTGISYVLQVNAPENLSPFLAAKGSVSLDGISLTISEITNGGFLVAIIPHTFDNTSLKFKKLGDLLNIEVDVMARYAINAMQNPGFVQGKLIKKNKDKILKEKLIDYGFSK